MLDKDACMDATCVDAAPDLTPDCTEDCPDEDMPSVDLEDMTSVDPDLLPSWELPEGMVEVPEGAFLMGSPQELDPSANFLGRGEHEVWLSRYGIDIYEVSVEAYQECVEQGVCTASGEDEEGIEQCNAEFADRGDHPINCVDWSQALAYCEFRGFTLPTEAQWEKAARGPEVSFYPWGNEPQPSCENTIGYGSSSEGTMKGAGCGRESTWPRGSRPKDTSGYGVVDTVGNVSEWVWDWSAWKYYEVSPERDPRGPESPDDELGMPSRSVRGGSWDWGGRFSSSRDAREPEIRSVEIGIRCAKNSIPIP